MQCRAPSAGSTTHNVQCYSGLCSLEALCPPPCPSSRHGRTPPLGQETKKKHRPNSKSQIRFPLAPPSPARRRRKNTVRITAPTIRISRHTVRIKRSTPLLPLPPRWENKKKHRQETGARSAPHPPVGPSPKSNAPEPGE